MEINSITERVIGGAFQVANTLGAGFLEKVYENAFAYELRSMGLQVEQQFPINVHYRDVVVGDYYADLLVQDLVIVELKAVKAIDDVHMAQRLNYLRATKLSICLLINFGTPRITFKRIAL